MVQSNTVGQVGRRGFSLKSVQRPDARVSLLYQRGDVEVMVVEVGAEATLAEPSLWGGPSWHLVVEGQAIFQQGDRRWELLPEESLSLRASAPYTIVNPAPGRAKLVSLVFNRADRRKGGQRP